MEQQRKTLKQDETLRPPHYNASQCSYPKRVHSIDSYACGPTKNWERNFGPPPQQRSQRPSEQRSDHYHHKGGMPGQGRELYTCKPPYCIFHGSEIDHCTKDYPIFLESKRKMEQDFSQPPQQSSSREVNHMMHWLPPHN
jgi:hypothetical protein